MISKKNKSEKEPIYPTYIGPKIWAEAYTNIDDRDEDSNDYLDQFLFRNAKNKSKKYTKDDFYKIDEVITSTSTNLILKPFRKKAKKRFVSEDQKDSEYWSKRNKNNIAAKRSRLAKRKSDTKLTLKVKFLEEENEYLK